MMRKLSPPTLGKLVLLNHNDEVGKALDRLTQNGEIRDYDDEIANRIEDAKDIIRGIGTVHGEIVALCNELSWNKKTRPLADRIRSMLGLQR